MTPGTIINNNTDTSATVDFSDAALIAGVQIDIEGNDLFNQIVLAPCLGVIEYQERLFWWGEINNIKNLINMGFDGGRIAPIGTAIPLGWSTAGTTSDQGRLVNIGNAGFAYQMTSAHGPNDCMISQPAYQDYYGAPIFLTPFYTFRCQASASIAGPGNLVCDLFSPSQGALGGARIPLATIGLGPLHWVTQAFDLLPNPLPADAILRVYLENAINTVVVRIDEMEIIDQTQPILNTQMRASYVANPFGYDDITGLVGIDSNESITGAFKQRGYLYPLTDRSRFVTQNNGSTEPLDWNVSLADPDCGCAGPCAVTPGAGVALWGGQHGLQIFTGDNSKKISQELQPTWDRINWTVGLRLWLVNDPIERVIYIGMPLDAATAPSIVQPISYRSVDSAYNVPDPLHTSYSGKLIATDLCRKSTIWNVTANCGCMITAPLPSGQGVASQMVFGGGNGQAPGLAAGFGELYTLDFDKYTDDDYGIIGRGTGNYYVTYAWWNHEIEEGAPGLGLHRKFYAFLSAYATGIGNLQITPYVDTLSNPVRPLRPYGLVRENLTHDLEWGMNVSGDRVFFKVQPKPLQVAQIITNISIVDNVLTVRANIALGADKLPVRASSTHWRG